VIANSVIAEAWAGKSQLEPMKKPQGGSVGRHNGCQNRFALAWGHFPLSISKNPFTGIARRRVAQNIN